MSLHINSEPGQIAPVVLMPGDPLRAKYMAEKFLVSPVLVSSTRNVFYYTGVFNGVRITIGASGMGCPSIGIYAYELYSSYDVKSIIRIGTAGAYTTELNVYDLVNTEKAYSESTFALEAFGYSENHFLNQGLCFSLINETAKNMNVNLRSSAIHSSDVFYRAKPGVPSIAQNNNCLAVEMEAFALFSTAQYLKRMAGTLLTISDVIPTGTFISPHEREQALLPMMNLAMHTGVAIVNKL